MRQGKRLEEDASEPLVAEVVGVGVGWGEEVYGDVWLAMTAMEGGVVVVVVVVVVVTAFLRRRAWSL